MDSQKQPPAYSQTKDELFSNLETSSAGLSEPEVDRRLKKYGYNVLNKKSPKSILNMLKEQIFDPMILILLGAATFSALLNEWVEGCNFLHCDNQLYYWYYPRKESPSFSCRSKNNECSNCNSN